MDIPKGMKTERKTKINVPALIADTLALLTGEITMDKPKPTNFNNYNEYICKNSASSMDIVAQRVEPLDPSPLISIGILCCGDDRSKALDTTLLSLIGQTNANWEAVIVLDLKQSGLERFDNVQNIRLIIADGDEAELTQLMNEEMDGAYTMRLMPGDSLTPDALYAMVQATYPVPGTEVVFSDSERAFKPDYSRYTLASFDSVGRPIMVSRNVFRSIGGFMGSSWEDNWLYNLKACSEAKHTAHVARVLMSTTAVETGSVVSERMLANIEKIFRCERCKVKVYRGNNTATARLRVNARHNPKTSIIIPNVDSYENIKRCIESIDMQCTYRSYKIYIAMCKNIAEYDERTKRYLEALKRDKIINIVNAFDADCMSEILNKCIRESLSEAMIFLNGSCELLTSDFVEELTGLAMLREIGAVGGKILDEQGDILSVGTVVGIGGWADSPYRGTRDDECDELKLSVTGVQRCVTAVSSAFMAIEGEKLLNSGMFDETMKGVGFDTELCIRLMRKGFKNCFTPYAKAKLYGQLPDYDKASNQDLLRCYDAYRQTLLTGDKFYNANFDWATIVPQLAIKPFKPIELNPLYKK